jgi:hypothetical protein
MSRLQPHFSATCNMKISDNPCAKPRRQIAVLHLYHNDVHLANTIPARSSWWWMLDDIVRN